MKKKELKKLVHQQAQTINKLQKENKYLRDKFMETKDFVMAIVAGLIGESK